MTTGANVYVAACVCVICTLRRHATTKFKSVAKYSKYLLRQLVKVIGTANRHHSCAWSLRNSALRILTIRFHLLFVSCERSRFGNNLSLHSLRNYCLLVAFQKLLKLLDWMQSYPQHYNYWLSIWWRSLIQFGGRRLNFVLILAWYTSLIPISVVYCCQLLLKPDNKTNILAVEL